MTARLLSAGTVMGTRETLRGIGAAVLLSGLFVFVGEVFGGRGIVFSMVLVVPCVLLAMLSFPMLISFLPMLFFGNNHILIFTTSEIYVLILTASFLLTHRNIEWRDLRFPMFGSFLIYFAVQILSIVKSVSPFQTLYDLNHSLFLFLIITVVYAGVRRRQLIQTVITVYLTGLALSTTTTILQAAISGNRAFGFSGIMFVDYVSYGIVLAVVSAVFAKTRKARLVYGALAIFYTIGSIMTQTRNTWLSTLIVIAIFFIVLGIRSAYFGFSRVQLRALLLRIGVVALAGVLLALAVNTSALSRLNSAETKSDVVISESGRVNSSFISRLFIWHTAFNAFRDNPVLGIGAYAFPITSSKYYTINKVLYQTYVERLTPHQTFIAVITETGIIGFIVFVFLYLRLTKFVFESLGGYSGPDDKRIGAVLAFGLLYCLVSMLSTDAWLWGHGLVLFGLSLGLLFAHGRNVREGAALYL